MGKSLAFFFAVYDGFSCPPFGRGFEGGRREQVYEYVDVESTGPEGVFVNKER
jgi:hypothetical protein